MAKGGLGAGSKKMGGKGMKPMPPGMPPSMPPGMMPGMKKGGAVKKMGKRGK